jgi:hypothetical protein
MHFEGLDANAARAFAERWLPAWTGDRPELLVSFYTEDTCYSDPQVPQGLRGRDALLGYFRKLLAANPDWIWTQRRSLPLENGFLNFWHASIPVGDRVLEIDGVCSVELRDGRIAENHVYFDRSALLAAHAQPRALARESFGPPGDPSRHLALAALDSGLRALPAAPRERGRTLAIYRRHPNGDREALAEALLTREEGVPGDGWSRRPPREAAAQLAVMQHDVAQLVANGQALAS